MLRKNYMNCKYLKIKLNKKFECKKTNKIINPKDCSSCKNKEYKASTEYCRPQQKNLSIKKKSSKLAKLERNRYSVFTDDLEYCIICGKKKEHIHEVFFGAYRQRSIKFNMCIPLCSFCHAEMHKNHEWQQYWHDKGQMYFEKNIGSRDEFIEVFGKSYLE